MLFNTAQFFVFLAAVLALFYSSPRRFRKYILLAASYFFYGSWNYRFIPLLLSLTAIDYTAGIWMEKVAAGPTPQGCADFEPVREPGFSGLLQIL